MKHILFVLVIMTSHCFAKEAPSFQEILNYIQTNLPHSGILKQAEGFVYVDLDDEYIHKLVTFIHADGFEKPPYFGNSEVVGAHITVIYPDEMTKYGIGEIEECGKAIHFDPKNCQVVKPPNWEEIEEVYFIVVESPELDRFRVKYGLPKREYDFHITIGVKPKI